MNYSYTKSVDFPNGLVNHQLHSEIQNSSIVPTLDYVGTDGDDVTICFNASLSGAEVTTLNGLVAAHTPNETSQYRNVLAFVSKNHVSQTSFKRLDTIVYNGSETLGTISRIVGVGHMDAGITSYTVRVYDRTNDAVIVESTFTNTSESSIVLSPISNVPSSSAILELHVKKTGGQGKLQVHVSSVVMYMT